MSDDTTQDDGQRPSDGQPERDLAERELAEHELETVAGGWGGSVAAANCGCGSLEGTCSCGASAKWD